MHSLRCCHKSVHPRPQQYQEPRQAAGWRGERYLRLSIIPRIHPALFTVHRAGKARGDVQGMQPCQPYLRVRLAGCEAAHRDHRAARA